MNIKSTELCTVGNYQCVFSTPCLNALSIVSVSQALIFMFRMN